MRLPDWFRPILSFLAWIIAAVLVVWLFILIRSSVLGLLNIYYVGDSVRRAWQVKLFDKIYALIAASVGLALIAAGEPYFEKLSARPWMLWGIARILGIELLAVGLSHSVLIALQGIATGPWLRWVALSAELLAGAALTAYGFLVPRPEQQD